ncbi:MBL fold metallo-hydrolase [Rhizobiales bacterium]|uniref:MBL fold metallo-hydrolase n=1 Tax=Hongsoonwoonella zoysiae TaxID=2821844 RepID=UPI0015602D84|nr:MBL fold metallo-hydrolase [Hongsoonwoonella zoysiae]NRG19673.1 MBL fold metallo-hydrolase [Hongsoonwoonella zoysiae]
MSDLVHERHFDPRHGEAVGLSDAVRRITARNPSPFTFHGTNTYLVGRSEIAVIDPGPEDETHVANILAAAGRAPIAAILVSHTHRDHSPAARMLKALTGAPVIGCAPHLAARPLLKGEINPLDASSDSEHSPDRVMKEGDAIMVDGLKLTALETPGHTANHLCFALDEGDILFSADHVMAWSTSIIAPPDGSMRAYMASLDKLMKRDNRIYFPGHGGPVNEPQRYLRGLKAHRHQRAAAILRRLAAGDRFIPEMVEKIYASTDKRLHKAAALSVLAQMEALVEEGKVMANGPVTLGTAYRLA